MVRGINDSVVCDETPEAAVCETILTARSDGATGLKASITQSSVVVRLTLQGVRRAHNVLSNNVSHPPGAGSGIVSHKLYEQNAG